MESQPGHQVLGLLKQVERILWTSFSKSLKSSMLLLLSILLDFALCTNVRWENRAEWIEKNKKWKNEKKWKTKNEKRKTKNKKQKKKNEKWKQTKIGRYLG
jgi:hypothetical protein